MASRHTIARSLSCRLHPLRVIQPGGITTQELVPSEVHANVNVKGTQSVIGGISDDAVPY